MIAIIIITIVVSGLGLLYPPIVKALCLDSQYFTDKKYYQIITCAFVHKNFNHLLNNLVIICYASSKLHTIASYNIIALVYMVSVLCASVFTILRYCSTQNFTACGASGGAFGLMAFALALGLPSCNTSIILACVLLIYMMLEMQLNDAFIAHLGGAVAGLLCSFFYTSHLHQSFHNSYIILALGFVFMAWLDSNKNIKK
jgi:membrane associated rhomboid family serine protease